MKPPTLADRAAGVLLHPTSLPGPYGSGDIGPEAYRFADALAAAGQRWWQTLPINPPSRPPGNSPYSSPSAFAGSPWLISPDGLVRDGLLGRRELAGVKRVGGRADFVQSQRVRRSLLRTAFERFAQGRRWRSAVDAFSAANAEWLDDYCLYAALKEKFQEAPWVEWPMELRFREPRAISAARRDCARAIYFHQFVQWVFDRQWRELRAYCNARGIGLIGDVPIFVSHESADVWARRELFLLDKEGRQTLVSGYPPDPMARSGQKWGHPHYAWPAHAAEDFQWWVERFGKTLQHYDAVRIDHFLGFDRAWGIRNDAEGARKGKWLKSPGDALFSSLRRRLGEVEIIAEDLGNPTPNAMALRQKFGFPGMRVLQFGFEDAAYHRPHSFTRDCVAYTGTHDNDTTAGWLRKVAAGRNGELGRIRKYVGLGGEAPVWDMIRVLYTSVANTVIVPAQDLFGVDSDERMNVPGTADGNWVWRMQGQLPAGIVRKLRALAEVTGRVG